MEPYYIDADGKIYTVLPYQELKLSYPFLHYPYRAGVQSKRGILRNLPQCPPREQKEMAKADLERYAELHNLTRCDKENLWLTVNRHLTTPRISQELNLACILLVLVALSEAIFGFFCSGWTFAMSACYQLFYLVPFGLFFHVFSLPIRAYRVLRGILLLLSALIFIDAALSIFCS